MIRSPGLAAAFISCHALAFADDPTGTDPGWQRTVSRELALAEYHSKPEGENRFVASNRAQDLRVAFTSDGITVRPRRESSEDFTWGLRLSAVGRDGDLAPPEAALPEACGGRIEYRRGQLNEWYVNDPRGIEQGFTLAAKPPDSMSGRDLVLELTVTGTLSATARDGGIDFTTKDGALVLRYDHLAVLDAGARSIAACMSLDDRTIRITVDDRDARYPLTIDPLATNPSWTAESDQADALFGFAVAGAGDVNGDGFFDVIVGAPRFDAGQSDEGRVFVYLGSVGGLGTSPAWTAEANQVGALLGSTVAGAGDVNGDGFSDVVVGAPRHDASQVDDGRVLVYLGSAAGLESTPAFAADGAAVAALFGTSVAGAGDANGDGFSDLVVGAPDYQGQDTGQAFVFDGSAIGPGANPSWAAISGHSRDWFGLSVGSLGDTNGDGFSDVVVGAPLFTNTAFREGAVFVYHGSPIGTSPTPQWTTESGQYEARLGQSVAGAGDVNGDGFADLVAGANQFTNGEFFEGAAFVHLGSATGLAIAPAWTGESDQPGAFFGFSVASAGDANGDGLSDVLAGAPWLDAGHIDEGRAFLYLGTATGVATAAEWMRDGGQAAGYFGQSVACAGDVDGSGFSDVLIGAHRADGGQSDEGRAFVFNAGGIGSAVPYGVGKPGTAGLPSLSSSAAPRLGTTADLTLTNGLAGAAPAFLFAGFAPASIPFDGGRLLVLPFTTAPLPPLGPAGSLVLLVPLPADPVLCGVSVYFQAGFVDPGAIGPYHTALTNGLHWTLAAP